MKPSVLRRLREKGNETKMPAWTPNFVGFPTQRIGAKDPKRC
jgi:hypothetical protein